MTAHDDDNGAALVVYDRPMSPIALRIGCFAAVLGWIAIGGGVWWWWA